MTTHADPMTEPAVPAPHTPEVLAAMIRKRAEGELELHQVSTPEELPAAAGYFRLGLLRAAEILDGLAVPQWRPGMVAIRPARESDEDDAVVVCREDRTHRGISVTLVPLTYLDGSIKGHTLGHQTWSNEGLDRDEVPKLADCRLIWPADDIAPPGHVDARPVPPIPDAVVSAVVAAVRQLPGRCKYHGHSFRGSDPRRFSGACCATGEPSLLRERALAELRAIGAR